MTKIDYADPKVVVDLIDDILQPAWAKGKVFPAYDGAIQDAKLHSIKTILDVHSMALAERTGRA